MKILKGTFIILAGLGAAYATASAFGAWRWPSAIDSFMAQLNAGRVAPDVTRYDAAELASLPTPVQRYFRAVLIDGQPIVTALKLTQNGIFNLGKTAPQWKPFAAVQHFTTAKPGFVWDAKTMMYPGVPVRVADA